MIKFLLILPSLTFIFFTNASSQVVNTKNGYVQFSTSLDSIPAIFDAEGEKQIQKMPCLIKKNSLKEKKIVLKANGYVSYPFFMANSIPFNIKIEEMAQQVNFERISIGELGKINQKDIQINLIKIPISRADSLEEIIFQDPQIAIPASSLLGLINNRKFEMIGTESAFDPVFGSRSSMKAEMNRTLEAYGFRIMNKRNNKISTIIKDSELMPYVSVEPEVSDFAFNSHSVISNNMEIPFGNYSLTIHYKLTSGSKEKIESIVVNGFSQSKDPHEIFNKALIENLVLFVSNKKILNWIHSENEILLKAAKARKVSLIRPTQMPTDLKVQIKQCMEATVTIQTDEGSFGSGFLISSDGLILTNFHVVSEATKISVSIGKDTTQFSAKLIKYHDWNDLALLKIDTKREFFLELDSSASYEVGDLVMAIGTPASLKLGQSVSRGIVSGKRVINSQEFIQTDVSINPGNSGGPLIDQNGKVIGIVVKKIVGRDYEGLGFAIPSKLAFECLNLVYE
ncbi:MAG: trypsin-like peptidase domain-containing protein [Bacteroidia bacterium]|nr:trypsin-like peptidase domain-containing protein [Bacteroidia bacterium]MCF8427394.1 trypsin-like peptidase domain-containing protein [Bacteroidia bacterium]MCF8446130.1 trypsin-like peptidase domain-containing protein [Bacteroidia bacterium]